VPIACWWAAYHETRIVRRGVGLSASQLETAGRIGIIRADKVRLLSVPVIPPTNRLLRGLGMRLGFVSGATIGMTLRYGIYIQEDHWGDRRLLIHELAHVAQYERLGGFCGFMGPYLRECIDPGYPFGELEVEAQQAESMVY
jgi:hypothetical protein